VENFSKSALESGYRCQKEIKDETWTDFII